MEPAEVLRVLRVGGEGPLLAGDPAPQGIAVACASDGCAALPLARADTYAIALVNARLPGAWDGIELARRLRAVTPQTGLILMTAAGEAELASFALEEIVDDCVSESIDCRELLARMRALVRRCVRARSVAPLEPSVLAYQTIRLDPIERRVTVDTVPVRLQPRQFDLLAYLMRRAGRAVSQDELLPALWQTGHEPHSPIVRVQISLLRKALGAAGQLIETADEVRSWGIGLTRMQPHLESAD